MTKTIFIFLMALVCSLFPLFIPGHARAGTDEARRITKEELKSILANPHTIVIDVRQEGAWKDSDLKIKGAVHEDPLDDEKTWAKKYPKDANVILYCS